MTRRSFLGRVFGVFAGLVGGSGAAAKAASPIPFGWELRQFEPTTPTVSYAEFRRELELASRPPDALAKAAMMAGMVRKSMKYRGLREIEMRE